MTAVLIVPKISALWRSEMAGGKFEMRPMPVAVWRRRTGQAAATSTGRMPGCGFFSGGSSSIEGGSRSAESMKAGEERCDEMLGAAVCVTKKEVVSVVAPYKGREKVAGRCMSIRFAVLNLGEEGFHADEH